jgi:uncharacterized protein (DUF608 family)
MQRKHSILGAVGLQVCICAFQLPADNVGPPLGGIGAGGLSINPINGTFERMSIYSNMVVGEDWLTGDANCYFAFWSATTGARKINTATAQTSYRAVFPRAYIGYNSGDPDIELSLIASGPITPFDEKTSSLPLIIYQFSAHNKGTAAKDAAVAFGWNPQAGGTGVTAVADSGKTIGIDLAYSKTHPQGGAVGSNTILVDGDGPTAIKCGREYAEFSATGAYSGTVGGNYGGVSAKTTISAGETKKITFIFTYYNNGPAIPKAEGYRYQQYFKKAGEVALHGLRTYPEIFRQIENWHTHFINGSNFPSWFTTMLIDDLHPMVQSGVWDNKNRAGVFEYARTWPYLNVWGLEASGNLGYLWHFPQWAQENMLTFGRAQCADGHYPHNVGWEAFDAVCSPGWKGNNYTDHGTKWVLTVYQYFMNTNDTALIRQNWTRVLNFMNWARGAGDANKDGLMDVGYNSWEHYLCNQCDAVDVYAAGLHLSTMLAAAKLAAALGQTAYHDQWLADFTKGKQSYEKLWGTWDGAQFYRCCSNTNGNMVQTMSPGGEGWLLLLGLNEGNLHVMDHAVQQVQYVFKNNRRKAGDYPMYECGTPGVAPVDAGSRGNRVEPRRSVSDFWVTAIFNGMANEAGGFFKANWNEFFDPAQYTIGFDYDFDWSPGSGMKYSTAPISWTAYQAFLGYYYDAPNKKLRVKPNLPKEGQMIMGDTVAACLLFANAACYGKVTYRLNPADSTQYITLISEKPVPVRLFRIRKTGKTPIVVVKGTTLIGSSVAIHDDENEITLDHEIQLDATPTYIYPEGKIAALKMAQTVERTFQRLSLQQNRIVFMVGLCKPDRVRLAIYTLNGQLAIPVAEAHLSAGIHSIDRDLSALPVGTYVCRVKAEKSGLAAAKTICLVK